MDSLPKASQKSNEQVDLESELNSATEKAKQSYDQEDLNGKRTFSVTSSDDSSDDQLETDSSDQEIEDGDACLKPSEEKLEGMFQLLCPHLVFWGKIPHIYIHTLTLQKLIKNAQ